MLFLSVHCLFYNEVALSHLLMRGLGTIKCCVFFALILISEGAMYVS